MKVGSLVQLVNDSWNKKWYDLRFKLNINYPIKNKIYTIRFIRKGGLGFEEIINPKFSNVSGNGEPNFDINRFRELLPPMEINLEAILEKVEV